MNFKVFFLAIFISISLVNISQIKANNTDNIIGFYNENIIPDFTKENAGDKNSIYYMYLFDKYLNDKSTKLSSGTGAENKGKIEIINKLVNINKNTINNKLYSFDNNPEIIKEITDKFNAIDKKDFDANKPERYKKYIKLINNTGYLNTQDKEGKTLFFQVLKYGDYELLDFILNRGLNQNIVNNDGNTAAMLFTTLGKHYSQDLDDKTKAGELDTKATIKFINLLIRKNLNINNINKNAENILFNAIRLGNKDLIETLIKSGVDINIRNNESLSPLMIAITKKLSNDILSLFIENKNFDSTLVNITGDGYLHQMILEDTKILTKLLQITKDLNLINSYGESPLIKLVKESRNEEDIITKLNLFLNKGNINLNTQDNLGKSIFLYSIEKKYNKLSKLLMEKGINPLQKDIEGNTALIYATKNNDLETINKLIELGKYNLNSQNNLGETALHIAFSKGYFGIINLLLEKGIDLDSFNLEKQNILIQAIEKADIKVLNDISKYNPDYEVEIENGTTPIFLAIKRENIEIIKKLIELGVDIKHIDDKGKNPIYLAINENNFNITKLLIDKGIDLQTVELKENTSDEEDSNIEINKIPLAIVACVQNNYNIVKLLINNNIDINELDSNGKNCLNYSTLDNSINISKLLIDNGININNKDKEEEKTPLITASELGYTDLVKLLIKSDVNLDISDANKRTPLIAATLNGFTKVGKILIEAGANINKTDQGGMTALYYSVKGNNIELIKLLLSKGINNINISNEEGNTMLIQASMNNYIEISDILIKSGINIYKKNNEGFDAIYYATINNSSEIFKLLLEKDSKLIYNKYDGKSIENLAKDENNLDILHILKQYKK